MDKIVTFIVCPFCGFLPTPSRREKDDLIQKYSGKNAGLIGFPGNKTNSLLHKEMDSRLKVSTPLHLFSKKNVKKRPVRAFSRHFSKNQAAYSLIPERISIRSR
jgi:hypothetical protein